MCCMRASQQLDKTGGRIFLVGITLESTGVWDQRGPGLNREPELNQGAYPEGIRTCTSNRRSLQKTATPQTTNLKNTRSELLAV
jgi:hypothetical protein